METIKVNMNPNPLDVQTIHASQNDGEARQWGFELHNNGDVIDASEISDQLVFKAYKGGTEQILPENGSVPTTAPFLGDIRYPQGLLTDQEFTYRQSPTEEDGLAKITDVKGNTLVWNQLLQNGNFETITGWSQNDTANTLSVASNEMTVTVGNPIYTTGFYGLQMHDRIANHKYLFVVSIYSPIATTFAFGNTNDGIRQNVSVGWNTLYGMVTNTVTVKSVCCYLDCRNLSAGSTFKVKNYQAFDLTKMGLDVTAQEFVSYFPLSYYPYDSGSLLSFNGNGIKITGKNLLEVSANSGNIIESVDEKGYMTSKNNFPVGWQLLGNFYAMANKQYTISVTDGFTNSYSRIALGLSATLSPTSSNTDTYADTDIGAGVLETLLPSRRTKTFISNKSQLIYIWLCSDRNNTGSYPKFTFACQAEFGSINSAYEPYITQTTNLPISTYFPTGMKSAGTAYDELTPTKATAKMGRYELGLLDWTTGSSGWSQARDSSIIGAKAVENTQIANIICPAYTTKSANKVYSQTEDKTIAISSGGYVQIYDSSFADKTAAEIKQLLSGVYLDYELATPTETPITTASLVTENAEIPLSNEDGVLIGKCTEQLSENPGFIDAKIKLADADGECYSNKIQLHVERSPQ